MSSSSYVNWMLFLATSLGSMTSSWCVLDEPIYHELSHEQFIGKPKSQFGYSIAYQSQIKQLVVGSPTEDIIGQVYLCPPTKNCTKVKSFEPVSGDDNYNISSWYGARVDVGKSFFMACAPRHMEHIEDEILRQDLYSTKGQCYYVDVSQPEWSPIKFTVITDSEKKAYAEKQNQLTNNTEYRTDSFGWSSHVVGNTSYVGGPIMSIGRVYRYKYETRDIKLIPVNNVELDNTFNKPISFNFGYSITSGYFLSDSPPIIAISTPYGTIGHGRVYFYDPADEEKLVEMWVNGEEIVEVGSLFGACLSSLLLSEYSSALLVGAPAYRPKEAVAEYDIGAVFIYRFDLEEYEPQLVKKLLPLTDDVGGRFGASMVTIGDFNGDQISEIAVAAPFANDGRGVVYIYSSNLLLDGDLSISRVKWDQRLLPKEMDMPLYYGYSLASLEDADENGCNELAIGAPKQNFVNLFYCVASLEAEFINLGLKDDVLVDKVKDIENGKNTSFIYEPCLKVKYGTKPDPATIKTNITFTVTVIHPSVRIYSGENNGVEKEKEIPLAKDSLGTDELCHPIEILLPQDGDYDQKISFNISVKVNQNPLSENIFDPKLVLLNEKIHFSNLTTLDVALPGSNVTFKTETTLKNNYTIGSTDKEDFSITMMNTGTAAHGACVRTRLGPITVTEMPRNICSVANRELVCKLEKLTRNANKTITVELSMKSLTSSDERLILFSELFTNNCQTETNWRVPPIKIELRKDTNIVIQTESNLKINATKQELNFSGKKVDHKYKIINNGATLWKNLKCEIALPSQVIVEKVTITSGTCTVIENQSFCNITQLVKNDPIYVRIQMKIEAGSPLAGQIAKTNASVDTSLSLKLTDQISKEYSISTTVTLREAAKVPMWMVVTAAMVGLLIVIVLMWVLHECGCMKRQNKEKLKELQDNVKRQSVRKSLMLRQSIIEVIPNKSDNSEREKLLKVPEEDIVSHNGEHQDYPTLPADHRVSVRPIDVDNDNSYKEQGAKDGKEQQTQNILNEESKDMINAQPVKEIHFEDDDPARVAFNAELAKALAKGNSSVVTEAEIH